MVDNRGGVRQRSRHKFSKNYRRKGKISIRDYFRDLKEGDRVVLKMEPAHQGGHYASRFHGLQGNVVSKQGSCYFVNIKDGGKHKSVLVHPVHLKVIT